MAGAGEGISWLSVLAVSDAACPARQPRVVRGLLPSLNGNPQARGVEGASPGHTLGRSGNPELRHQIAGLDAHPLPSEHRGAMGAGRCGAEPPLALVGARRHWARRRCGVEALGAEACGCMGTVWGVGRKPALCRRVRSPCSQVHVSGTCWAERALN